MGRIPVHPAGLEQDLVRFPVAAFMKLLRLFARLPRYAIFPDWLRSPLLDIVKGLTGKTLATLWRFASEVAVASVRLHLQYFKLQFYKKQLFGCSMAHCKLFMDPYPKFS